MFCFLLQPSRTQEEEEEEERWVHVCCTECFCLHSNVYWFFRFNLTVVCSGRSRLSFFLKTFLGKLPKNYDPNVTPDPERWLPMRERSYYRGKKKGKKKDQIGKGTQGATAGASAELWVDRRLAHRDANGGHLVFESRLSDVLLSSSGTPVRQPVAPPRPRDQGLHPARPRRPAAAA